MSIHNHNYNIYTYSFSLEEASMYVPYHHDVASYLCNVAVIIVCQQWPFILHQFTNLMHFHAQGGFNS